MLSRALWCLCRIVPIATHLLALAVGAVLGKLLGGKFLSGRRVGAHKKHQKVCMHLPACACPLPQS